MRAAPLARTLTGHDVTDVRRRGWATLKNGRLLAAAQDEFDVLLTVDRGISFQQHLPNFSIGLLIVRAPSNRLKVLLPLAPDILAALPFCTPGTVRVVGTVEWRGGA